VSAAATSAAGAARVTVLCMKWGTKYGPEYVDRLYGMVARNLARPFRFVCLTDDPAGIRAEVTCAPIPKLPPIAQPKERGWLKLASFSPELAGLLDETVPHVHEQHRHVGRRRGGDHVACILHMSGRVR